MPPKVSVVIPTYNNAALLCETLDGVRRQAFKDFEIIVVDDGSMDEMGRAVSGLLVGVLPFVLGSQNTNGLPLLLLPVVVIGSVTLLSAVSGSVSVVLARSAKRRLPRN